ncbi:uncharacterized protein A1O5_09395 [Cladophialophora psammophila CBS 110553]|uniref:Uncharacterized protein n=1 Tax=Cladophialophora psammophila CBS 110553 TaxID=1182543 RepID=W9WGZ4_9EURO|nr:uncharacterized protein A1O5_09395 [Cladophialophora psammophila CBS 110553]EXJ67382.1 hypothetical protein A1O5_09395 [Cladophialophora psammophila CBS 110553]
MYYYILDWHDLGAHRELQKWEYVIALEMTGRPFHYHANLEPHPPTAVYCEATGLLQLYFPLDYSKVLSRPEGSS